MPFRDFFHLTNGLIKKLFLGFLFFTTILLNGKKFVFYLVTTVPNARKERKKKEHKNKN